MNSIKITYGELKNKLSLINNIKLKDNKEENEEILSHLKRPLQLINRSIQPFEEKMNEEIQDACYSIEVKNARVSNDGKLIYESYTSNGKEKRGLTYTPEGEIKRQKEVKNVLKDILDSYNKKEIEISLELLSLKDLPKFKEYFDESAIKELTGFLFK